MITVTILDERIDSVLDIVHKLKKDGYEQGKDFDFAYHQPTYDTFGHEPPTRRRTVFSFYDEQLGMMFKLRYGG